jgi:hypothetical protein
MKQTLLAVVFAGMLGAAYFMGLSQPRPREIEIYQLPASVLGNTLGSNAEIIVDHTGRYPSASLHIVNPAQIVADQSKLQQPFAQANATGLYGSPATALQRLIGEAPVATESDHLWFLDHNQLVHGIYPLSKRVTEP